MGPHFVLKLITHTIIRFPRYQGLAVTALNRQVYVPPLSTNSQHTALSKARYKFTDVIASSVTISSQSRNMHYRVLMGKTEGKPWRRWENNIKMDLQKNTIRGVEWIHLALDKDKREGSCECGNEPSGPAKCVELSTSKNASFLTRILLHVFSCSK